MYNVGSCLTESGSEKELAIIATSLSLYLLTEVMSKVTLPLSPNESY